MLDLTINADASGHANPNPYWLEDADTNRPPVIMSGAGLLINAVLLDDGVREDVTKVTDLFVEIKPERGDREGGLPDVGDPYLLKKEPLQIITVDNDTAAQAEIDFTQNVQNGQVTFGDIVVIFSTSSGPHSSPYSFVDPDGKTGEEAATVLESFINGFLFEYSAVRFGSKVVVTTATSGAAGNEIAVSSTVEGASWNTHTFTGGKDASNPHASFVLSGDETVLDNWKRVQLSIHGKLDGVAKVWATGWADVKRVISQPGKQPLRALQNHEALVRLEGDQLEFYYLGENGELVKKNVLSLVDAGMLAAVAESSTLLDQANANSQEAVTRAQEASDALSGVLQFANARGTFDFVNASSVSGVVRVGNYEYAFLPFGPYTPVPGITRVNIGNDTQPPYVAASALVEAINGIVPGSDPPVEIIVGKNPLATAILGEDGMSVIVTATNSGGAGNDVITTADPTLGTWDNLTLTGGNDGALLLTSPQNLDAAAKLQVRENVFGSPTDIDVDGLLTTGPQDLSNPESVLPQNQAKEVFVQHRQPLHTCPMTNFTGHAEGHALNPILLRPSGAITLYSGNVPGAGSILNLPGGASTGGMGWLKPNFAVYRTQIEWGQSSLVASDARCFRIAFGASSETTRMPVDGSESGVFFEIDAPTGSNARVRIGTAIEGVVSWTDWTVFATQNVGFEGVFYIEIGGDTATFGYKGARYNGNNPFDFEISKTGLPLSNDSSLATGCGVQAIYENRAGQTTSHGTTIRFLKTNY